VLPITRPMPVTRTMKNRFISLYLRWLGFLTHARSYP
jgi:hypothetical protein